MNAETGMAYDWSMAAHRASSAEGWIVSYADREDGARYEIQRLDESGVFDSDADALAHVYDNALRGSFLHRLALLFTLQESES